MAADSSLDFASRSFSSETLRSLVEASAHISSSLDYNTVLDSIAESAARVMQAEGGSVLVLDKARQKLLFVSATGERGKALLGKEFDANLGVAGRVVQTGRAEVVADTQSDADWYAGIDKMTSLETRMLMAAPMVVASEVIGVVEVMNRVGGRFTEDDLDLLQVFANLAAVSARNAKQHERLRQKHRALSDQVFKGQQIIGASKALRDVQSLCDRVAKSVYSVLLLGETGTGKELFAKYIHGVSPRAEEAFVPVHCAALSETLLESELFGHEKGAFTGAVAQHAGRFESAEGGTIFLDEIGEVPLATQVKLLRVLQEREFERVGGSTTIKADVRVVAATNRDLKAEIAKGTFREDLYYRLNVVPIELPPLRERRDDVGLLVDFFGARAAKQMGVTPPEVSTGASAALMQYDWPGNVRELQNIMERAVLMCDGGRIEVTDLPLDITGPAAQAGGEESDSSLRGFERAMIVKALRDLNWNQTQAAKHLGISRDNLRYRIKKYEIKRDE
jgi:Nif-specific regulatory protein